MPCNISFVDREDQLEWFVQPEWACYCVNVKDRKVEIRKWLEECANGEVVIFGGGKLPEPGSAYQIWTVYHDIQRNNYKIYFEDPSSALLFKLAFG